MTEFALKMLSKIPKKRDNLFLQSAQLQKDIWDIWKKNFTGRPKSVVSFTSFGGGRKLGKIKLISSYKTRRALQEGTAKLILNLEGQNNLLEIILIIIQRKLRHLWEVC